MGLGPASAALNIAEMLGLGPFPCPVWAQLQTYVISRYRFQILKYICFQKEKSRVEKQPFSRLSAVQVNTLYGVTLQQLPHYIRGICHWFYTVLSLHGGMQQALEYTRLTFCTTKASSDWTGAHTFCSQDPLIQ